VKEPLFRIEAEFSINEFLSLYWALQWAEEHARDSRRPQKQTMRKLAKEDRRIWALHRKFKAARKAAKKP